MASQLHQPPNDPRKDSHGPKNEPNTPHTRAQTFLSSATTLPGLALIHSSRGITTVTRDTIINNRLLRQGGDNEVNFMTHDRLNERIQPSTSGTIEEITVL